MSNNFKGKKLNDVQNSYTVHCKIFRQSNVHGYMFAIYQQIGLKKKSRKKLNGVYISFKQLLTNINVKFDFY